MAALVLEQVTKQFDNHTAVDQLGFEAERGEIYGLLGANGAGKTTTMRMVLGIIAPDAGRILWNGRPHSREFAHVTGYLPEERGLYPKIKVNEQIRYLAQLHGMSRSEADTELRRWLDRFDIGEYYDKRVEELSKGNQQKIQFVAAVIHRPQLLILDEVFSGLDPLNVELVKSVVKELRDAGTTILFSTHRTERVEELCHRITILQKSQTVLQGPLRQIKDSFPKHQIALKTNAAVHGLHSLAGVKQVDENEQGYDIRFEGEDTPSRILQHAMAQTTVVKFEVMEPTLNQIFIQAVGGGHDA